MSADKATGGMSTDVQGRVEENLQENSGTTHPAPHTRYDGLSCIECPVGQSVPERRAFLPRRP
jgi:hypothetical protein